MAHRIYTPTTNMAMSTLQNVVLEAIAGNGTKVNQLRVNPTTRAVEAWNGTQWVSPATASVPPAYKEMTIYENSTDGNISTASSTIQGFSLNLCEGLRREQTVADTDNSRVNIFVDYNISSRVPNAELQVSNTFPSVTNHDEYHFSTIDRALQWAIDVGDPCTIVIHSGTYNINLPIPANVYVYCMPGVSIFNSVINMEGGGRWTGSANVGRDDGSYFIVRINPQDTTPVTIEANRAKILLSGLKAHIKVNNLETLVCSVSDNKSENVGNFDVQADVLELGNVYTTRVDVERIDMQYIVEPNFLTAINAYCACSWTNNVSSCPYSQTCIMSTVGVEGAAIRDSDKNKLQIRCNKRYGKAMVSVGYVDIFGQRLDIANNTVPTNYVTGIDLEPRLSSRLRINGLYERYDGSIYPYQVENDGVLVLENCNIKNSTTDGSVVGLSPTGYLPCSHVSVNSSRLF